MNASLVFTRTLFTILSVFFMTVYVISGPDGIQFSKFGLGLAIGLLFSAALIGFDILFKRFNLRSFNIAVLGLFFGYLMGQALVLILSVILEIGASSFHFSDTTLEVFKIGLFLFGIYTGTLMTLRSSDEIYISIPFVRFSMSAQKKRDLVVDGSILHDSRLIDLSSSGIFDSHLVLPRFLIKELYLQAETCEEPLRSKAKKSLELIKKLEALPSLDVRYNDTDFSDVKDLLGKTVRLARLLDGNILTADGNQIHIPTIEGVRFINIHDLSKALKPLTQTGEKIKIKIQRIGKEPRQGVGYLDDGTMVVINGGGSFLSETIEATVLSVKHTSSGRIIFCNAPDETGYNTYYHDEE